MSWHARWFDGHSSTPHAVQVFLEGQRLHIEPAGEQAPAAPDIPVAQLAVGERFRAAPRMLGLPGGSSLQVQEDDSGGFDRALADAGHRPSLVYRLIERWRSVWVCLVLLMSVIVWLDRQGVGLMASVAVSLVPPAADAALGRSALSLADAQWLTASQVPAERQKTLSARFMGLVQDEYPDLDCQVLFRGTRPGWDDFNAFAVPGGTIVLLDGVSEVMSDEEVLAILGHELGHLAHRDSMHALAQQMGLLAAASVLWGDVSRLAASAAAGLEQLRFSRGMEADADAFAVSFLRRGGIPGQPLAAAFAVIQREESRRGSVPAFLSGHPPTAARLSAAQADAGKPVSASHPASSQ